MTEAKQGIWLVETGDGGVFVIWSEKYRISSDKAIRKLNKMTGGRVGKSAVKSSRILTCSVRGCCTFASQLLVDEALETVPGEWWVLGEVERFPGAEVGVATSCPMCEKHARRFRRSFAERILRIEERIDNLEDELNREDD